MLFDDDMIPAPKFAESCLEEMNKQEGIYGAAGVKLRGNYYHPHDVYGWNGQEENKESMEVDLVGHVWFLKREHARYLWYEEPIDWDNGEDIQLSYLAQKYGGVQTFCIKHPRDDQDVWGCIPEYRQLGYNAAASSLQQPFEFLMERTHIVRKAIKLGWKPLYLQ